jgi:hypothetical protein
LIFRGGHQNRLSSKDSVNHSFPRRFKQIKKLKKRKPMDKPSEPIHAPRPLSLNGSSAGTCPPPSSRSQICAVQGGRRGSRHWIQPPHAPPPPDLASRCTVASRSAPLREGVESAEPDLAFPPPDPAYPRNAADGSAPVREGEEGAEPYPPHAR